MVEPQLEPSSAPSHAPVPSLSPSISGPQRVCVFTLPFYDLRVPVVSVSPSALESLPSWPLAHVNLCFLGSHMFGSICQLLWACWLPPLTASSGTSPGLLRGVDLCSQTHMFPTSFQGRHVYDSRGGNRQAAAKTCPQCPAHVQTHRWER